MEPKRLPTYGYEKGSPMDVHKNGLHSVLFDAVKSFDPEKKKEKGVIAKVLHRQGKTRSLSYNSENREQFILKIIEPLKEDLKLLDSYFSEFIPPYYLEVGDGEERDLRGNLEIPVTMYVYKVEEKAGLSEEDQERFKKQLIDFFERCISFLDKQLKEGEDYLQLPDIKEDSFIFGRHMGDDIDRLYFIDQYPVFLSAERVMENLETGNFESQFPYIKEVSQRLFEKLKYLNHKSYDWDVSGEY